MLPQEIKPKQLRALLLLLVLVPLIPAALMARFMTDALRGEQAAVLERTTALYNDTVSSSVQSFHSVASESETVRAAHLVDHLRSALDSTVTVRILDGSGKLLAGEPAPWGTPVSQIIVPGEAWQAHVHLTGPAVIEDQLSGIRRSFLQTGILSTLAVLIIAIVAALAVNRQLDLHDLKTTSVAMVAHELRTPLASMRMLVDTLRDGRYRDATQLQEYLDLIAKENERLSRLAENFLTYSRLEHGTHPLQLEAITPKSIADQAVDALQSRLADSDFTLAVDAALPTVRADRDALATVLLNLLENALKYSGEIKRISLQAQAELGVVTFAVTDNGTGLTPEQQRDIFRPFYQADQKLSRTHQGCGLGLAIVQRIVKAHDGTVRVESEPGRGYTFFVQIPQAHRP